MERGFGAIADLVRLHAQHTPDHAALADAHHTLTYGALDALMDRVAAALQRDGLVAAADSSLDHQTPAACACWSA